MFFMSQKKSEMISPEAALSGRDTALTTAKTHFLSGRPLKAEVPLDMQKAMFGMAIPVGTLLANWIPAAAIFLNGRRRTIYPNPKRASVALSVFRISR